MQENGLLNTVNVLFSSEDWIDQLWGMDSSTVKYELLNSGRWLIEQWVMDYSNVGDGLFSKVWKDY